MQQAWGRRGIYVGFWWEGQKKRDHSEDLHIAGIIIKIDLRETGWGL
jgi:hypothetical protein